MALKGKRKLMIAALKENKGVVSPSAEQAGISRKSHYDWLKSDEEYKEAYEEIAEGFVDFVESALVKEIEKGNTACIIFALKSRGKNRGWSEKQEIEHSGEVKGITGVSIEIVNKLEDNETES